MVNAIVGSIGQTVGGGFAREFSGEKFVGGQLAVRVVLHGTLTHLRRVGRRVRSGRRHIGMLAGIHRVGKGGMRVGGGRVDGGAMLRMVVEGGS